VGGEVLHARENRSALATLKTALNVARGSEA
jgi:hypothetical protein